MIKSSGKINKKTKFFSTFWSYLLKNGFRKKHKMLILGIDKSTRYGVYYFHALKESALYDTWEVPSKNLYFGF